MFLLRNIRWNKVAELLGIPLFVPSYISCAICRKRAVVIFDLSLRVPVIFCTQCQKQWDVLSYLSLLYLGQIPDYGTVQEHLQSRGIIEENFDFLKFVMHLSQQQAVAEAHRQLLDVVPTRRFQCEKTYQAFKINIPMTSLNQFIPHMIPVTIQDIPDTVEKDALGRYKLTDPCILIPAWASFTAISGYLCVLTDGRTIYLPAKGLPPIHGIPNLHSFFGSYKRRADNNLFWVIVDPYLYIAFLGRNLLRDTQLPPATLLCDCHVNINNHWTKLELPPLLFGARFPHVMTADRRLPQFLLSVMHRYKIVSYAPTKDGYRTPVPERPKDHTHTLESLTVDIPGHDMQTIYLNLAATYFAGYRTTASKVWLRSGIWSNGIITTDETGMYYNENKITNYRVEVLARIGTRFLSVLVVHEQLPHYLLIHSQKFISDAHQSILKQLPQLAGTLTCHRRYRKHLAEIAFSISDPEVLPGLPAFTDLGFRTPTAVIKYSGEISAARKLEFPYHILAETPRTSISNDASLLLALIVMSYRYEADCTPVVPYDRKTCWLLERGLEQINAPILTCKTAQDLIRKRSQLPEMHWPIGVIWKGTELEFIAALEHMQGAIALWPKAKKFAPHHPISVFIAKGSEIRSWKYVSAQFQRFLVDAISGNISVTTPFLHSTINKTRCANLFTLTGSWSSHSQYAINVIDYYLAQGVDHITALEKAVPILKRSMQKTDKIGFHIIYIKLKKTLKKLKQNTLDQKSG